jgi:hypothetical protein
LDNIKIAECDVIYLSYDEPNAEKNYADICTKVPWVKRVHGIKGSDAAHKACAELSDSDRFITVDGDNIIDANFINTTVDISKDVELEKCVISWCGKNIINNLVYGNGGLKCWPKEYVLNMRTHENADPSNEHAQVDFCWDAQYIQMNETYSHVYNNTTPQQAWRAGFREGVKLALDRGIKIQGKDILQSHWKNLHMLYVWCMIGADVRNGSWAIYGAREGLYKTMCTDWDFLNVRDFEYLNNYWTEKGNLVEEDVGHYSAELGNKLINHLSIPIATDPLDAEQSLFFKSVYQNPSRKILNG